MRKPVLTIFYQFNPWFPSIGGIQTVIRYFIKYAASEFDVRVVGTSDRANFSARKWQEAELEGKAIQFFPLLTVDNDDVRGLLPTTVKYTVALSQHNFASDFMHFHRIEPTLASLNWQGDKTLFIHNDIRQQMTAKDNKKAILWRYFPAGYFALEGLLIKQFAEILSCNTESVKLYQQRYAKLSERIKYIKNPVDNGVFYPLSPEQREEGRRALAARMGVSDDTRFLLFAGRLHPQKDPVLLVRSLFAMQQPNVHLLIAGAGELAETVKAEIAQLDLSQQVTLLGAVPPTQLAKLQQVCSTFVLTSAYEGLPLVALEALACGTPVVTTDCGETPKLLNAGSGIVCQERTPEAIASAISQILLRDTNYTIEACVQAAAPYGVRQIVRDVYQNMWVRWEQRQLASGVSTSYV
ncbi:glycosyltransferase family 4 protein [Scytonema millei]|uniref:Glycosyltransferase family 4 protein n=1 Tax=Scytonema millei VB511283 TaxID=1245923 RepID=A0A9X5E6D0_9CYAN|nr:glycosyltransferase family 4 protein [Scytonema millei]NHC36185.1 glycosyltransferase family 4 protein [Scytonema millei VB511283]